MQHNDEGAKKALYYRCLYFSVLVIFFGFVVIGASYIDVLTWVSVWNRNEEAAESELRQLGYALISTGVIAMILISNPLKKIKAVMNMFLPKTAVITFMLTDDNAKKLDELTNEGWSIDSMEPPHDGPTNVKFVVVLKKIGTGGNNGTK